MNKNTQTIACSGFSEVIRETNNYSLTTKRNDRFVCSISLLLIPNLLATTRQLEIALHISFKILSALSLFNWYKWAVSKAKEISNSLLFSEIFKVSPLPISLWFMSYAGDKRHPNGVRINPWQFSKRIKFSFQLNICAPKIFTFAKRQYAGWKIWGHCKPESSGNAWHINNF